MTDLDQTETPTTGELATLEARQEQTQAEYDNKTSELGALEAEEQKKVKHHSGMLQQERILLKAGAETEARAFQQAANDEWIPFGKSSELLDKQCAERRLLARAITHHQAFPLEDAHHSVLVARHALAVAREKAELARRDFHVGKITQAMSEAAALAGGSIAIQDLGPVAKELDEFCNRAAHEARAAQRAVESHAREMEETRRKLHTMTGDLRK